VEGGGRRGFEHEGTGGRQLERCGARLGRIPLHKRRATAGLGPVATDRAGAKAGLNCECARV